MNNGSFSHPYFASIMLLVFMATGCAPSVSRYGYEPRGATDPLQCRIALKRGATFARGQVATIGQVEIGDTGFTTSCDEETVVALLRKEGCEAGADVVNIVEEHRPDLSSSCYRAKADLLRLRSSSHPVTDDARFAHSSVEARSQLDNDRTSAVIWGAVIAGIIGGVVAGIAVSAGH